MTTFVLKKYEEPTSSPNTEQTQPSNEEKTPEQNKKEITVLVQGSIAEIVGDALRKVMTKDVEITEVANEPSSVIKAISAESITQNPVDTFQSINKNDTVFIQGNGFNTKEQEWFLMNLENKTSNVFYSVESFVKHLCDSLGVTPNES